VTESAEDDGLITTFGRLVEAHSSLGRQLGRSLESQAGIPQAWFEVLLRIGRSEGGRISMGALASQVALTSGGVTRLVDRLIDGGLVERIPCPTDRRVSFAALTPAGQDSLRRATAVHVADLRRVFAGFDDADLRTLDDLLDRLREARLG
jgi:MarR family transcriptional regulator, 2-MHQ and catechol-resistance regulon repressor